MPPEVEKCFGQPMFTSIPSTSRHLETDQAQRCRGGGHI